MKTSTKLLVIVFISIPVLLYAYNWLLREQFIAGKLEERKYIESPGGHLRERRLPAFKHLVINGSLRSGPTKMSEPYPKDWGPDIAILKASDQQQNIKVNKLYESMLQTRMNKDTLFIGFYREKRIKNFPTRWYDRLLTIHLNNVNSISSMHGNYTIQSLVCDSLKVISNEGSNVILENSAITKLEVLAKDQRVTISGNNKIKELHYSLLNNSHLNLDHSSNGINKFIPGVIDTSATISLTGKALAAHKYMAR